MNTEGAMPRCPVPGCPVVRSRPERKGRPELEGRGERTLLTKRLHDDPTKQLNHRFRRWRRFSLCLCLFFGALGVLLVHLASFFASLASQQISQIHTPSSPRLCAPLRLCVPPLAHLPSFFAFLASQQVSQITQHIFSASLCPSVPLRPPLAHLASLFASLASQQIFAFPLAKTKQMFYYCSTNALEKLHSHPREACLDRDANEATCPRPQGHLPVYWAAAGGRSVPILKTLVTSACERNCAYCPFRAGRDVRRQTFRPSELAAQIATLTHKGIIQGALLSSGIAGGSVSTQDRILETAAQLRQQGYSGYLHIKLMPGAEQDQILEALRLADRVSVNLEAPGARFLGRLAPQKRFWGELLQTLQRAASLRKQAPQEHGRSRWPSLVTQFVVGASQESDRDLLTWTARLFHEFDLRRVYFSAFRPIAQTPLENLSPERPERVRRLYQASFLLRDYGFTAEELFPPGEHTLPTDDPKRWWAWQHLAEQPVELNRAPREQLLRVPGIGPKRAEALLRARQQGLLHSLTQLQALGIPVQRAAPFILLNGRRPPYQRALW